MIITTTLLVNNFFDFLIFIKIRYLIKKKLEILKKFLYFFLILIIIFNICWVFEFFMEESILYADSFDNSVVARDYYKKPKKYLFKKYTITKGDSNTLAEYKENKYNLIYKNKMFFFTNFFIFNRDSLFIQGIDYIYDKIYYLFFTNDINNENNVVPNDNNLSSHNPVPLNKSSSSSSSHDPVNNKNINKIFASKEKRLKYTALFSKDLDMNAPIEEYVHRLEELKVSRATIQVFEHLETREDLRNFFASRNRYTRIDNSFDKFFLIAQYDFLLQAQKGLVEGFVEVFTKKDLKPYNQQEIISLIKQENVFTNFYNSNIIENLEVFTLDEKKYSKLIEFFGTTDNPEMFAMFYESLNDLSEDSNQAMFLLNERKGLFLNFNKIEDIVSYTRKLPMVMVINYLDLLINNNIDVIKLTELLKNKEIEDKK